LQVRKRHRLELVTKAGHADRGGSDQAAALIAAVGHPARVVDLYEGAEIVGETEAVGDPEGLEIEILGGGRGVIVGDARVETSRWAPSMASDGIHDREVTEPSSRVV
jgi:hypothetical protein